MPLLEVKNLRVQFSTRDGPVRALDGVEISLEAGRTLALVGESGSGKTVTGLAVMGLLPTLAAKVEGGPVLFEGRDLLTLSESEMRKLRGDRLAMIFQDPMTALNPMLTIGRQLTEVIEVHRGMRPAQAREEALRMLEEVSLPDPSRRVDQYPHELSGGMRQRVMIAMALLLRPSLLIADEPTTALDVTIQAQILELMGTLRQKYGTAVLLITHDLGVVAGMADEVTVMYAGRIVERAPVRELFERPQHPYTQGLIASLPLLEGAARKGALKPIQGQPPHPAHLPPGCPFHPRCPLAIERCARERPPLETLLPEHSAACWVARDRVLGMSSSATIGNGSEP